MRVQHALEHVERVSLAGGWGPDKVHGYTFDLSSLKSVREGQRRCERGRGRGWDPQLTSPPRAGIS